MRVLLKRLLRSFVREVSVDVADIVCAADWRDVGRRYLSSFELGPIYGLKEGMVLDFFDAKSIDRVARQKASEQISCLCRETWQNEYVLLGNTLQNFMSALVPLHGLLLERIDSTDHLIEEHAEAPPIDTKTVTDRLYYFRGKILRCAAEGICLSILGLLDLAQTKICQLQMPLIVKQHVFRF